MQGSLFPQTTSIYHCSNTVCQQEKDKQEAIRKGLAQEKEQRLARQAEIKAKKN